ncbi:hypothetical protein OF117_03305 [Geodermatophilus sp. YIM 151500]|nr:hypothetical protein [Geodermatophilus sp. YIM 151500]MCV2488378.1 hypothetical protein [Geodermatophilus sp. YIM 151500]
MQRVLRCSEPFAGPGDHLDLPGRVEGRDQHGRTGVRREAADLTEECSLEVVAERQEVGERSATGDLLGRQQPGELADGERVAGGDLDEPVDDRVGRRGAADVLDQGGHGPARQAAELDPPDLRDVQPVGCAAADGEQDGDPLRRQPSRGEDQGVRGRRIGPLGVVHEADQASVAGRLAQQRQHSGGDEEPVAPSGVGEPNRGARRGRLRGRERGDQVEHRPQQLVEGGEGQLRLGLDAGRAEHPQVGCGPRRAVQQRGLADAGVPHEDDRRARVRAHGPHHVVQEGALGLAAMQHGARVSATPGADTGPQSGEEGSDVGSAPGPAVGGGGQEQQPADDHQPEQALEHGADDGDHEPDDEQQPEQTQHGVPP